MLKTDQQIVELINKSQKILICLPKTPSTDAIAAGLAMFLFLEKQSKEPKIVAADFALPHTHSFLPKSQEIFSDITALKKFIISVDVTKAQVEELNYDIHGDKLNIYLTPKNGFFKAQDVKAYEGEYTYDLIITLDAPDLSLLGAVYENNVELFYKTPIINIDHNPANEQYGQINLIEVTATAVSEILFELFERLQTPYLDEYMATNLLTGIISKTKSFKTANVTPRSLAIASHLISSGARREEIVKNLYQTKSIHALKLWGKALTKLNKDEKYRLVWANLTANDFIETGAIENELEKVVDELIVNTPEARVIFLVYEKPNFGSKALISTPAYIKARDLFQEYHPVGTQDFTYIELKDISLSKAETIILERLRSVVKD